MEHVTESVPTHLQRARAESFGAVAAEYDRLRPSYPDVLIDDLVTAAAPGRDVLDVGCGTGKVARLLAERGMTVLGVEIDPEMAEVARSHGITVEVSGFEAWPDGGRRFDLVTCGQAWHWIDPDGGLAKAAEVLRPRGWLVPFWNYARLDEDLHAAVEDVYRRLAPSLAESVTYAGRVNERIALEEWRHDPRVASVELRTYPWQRRYSIEDWLELVQTHSDHLQLDPARRAEVIAALRSAISAAGDEVLAQYTTYAVFVQMTG